MTSPARGTAIMAASSTVHDDYADIALLDWCGQMRRGSRLRPQQGRGPLTRSYPDAHSKGYHTGPCGIRSSGCRRIWELSLPYRRQSQPPREKRRVSKQATNRHASQLPPHRTAPARHGTSPPQSRVGVMQVTESREILERLEMDLWSFAQNPTVSDTAVSGGD